MSILFLADDYEIEKAAQSVKYLRRYRKGGRYVYVYADKKGGVSAKKLTEASEGSGEAGITKGDRYTIPGEGICTVQSVDKSGKLTYTNAKGEEFDTSAKALNTMILRVHASAIQGAKERGLATRQRILAEAQKVGNPKLIARAEEAIASWRKTHKMHTPRSKPAKKDAAPATAPVTAPVTAPAKALAWVGEHGTLKDEAIGMLLATSDILSGIRTGSQADLTQAAEGSSFREAISAHKQSKPKLDALFTDKGDGTEPYVVLLAAFDAYAKPLAPVSSNIEETAGYAPPDFEDVKEGLRMPLAHTVEYWAAVEEQVRYTFGSDMPYWAGNNKELAAAGLPFLRFGDYAKADKADSAKAEALQKLGREGQEARMREAGLHVQGSANEQTLLAMSLQVAIGQEAGIKFGIDHDPPPLKVYVGASMGDARAGTLHGSFDRSEFAIKVSEDFRESLAHEIWHARDNAVSRKTGTDESWLASMYANNSRGAKELFSFTRLLTTFPPFREKVEQARVVQPEYADYVSSAHEAFARFGEQLTAYRMAQAVGEGKTAIATLFTPSFSEMTTKSEYLPAEEFRRMLNVWESMSISKVFEDTIAKAL